ncbi:hypothetical protein TWF481_003184 [Arthrobotrys musiformis]|uniref:BTB domain-containing protein n=1 Tax=Arthrobotrys musiformis TaxID=47236 RepID=A0AAV9VS34_9PEZI
MPKFRVPSPPLRVRPYKNGLKQVEIPDVDPRCFKVAVGWIYGKKELPKLHNGVVDDLYEVVRAAKLFGLEDLPNIALRESLVVDKASTEFLEKTQHGDRYWNAIESTLNFISDDDSFSASYDFRDSFLGILADLEDTLDTIFDLAEETDDGRGAAVLMRDTTTFFLRILEIVAEQKPEAENS